MSKPLRPTPGVAPTIADAFRQAQLAHNRNDLVRAESLYRAILATRNDLVDAWHNLGALCHQTGRNREAAEYMGKALQLRPNAGDIACNLSVVLLALGRPQEALARAGQALTVLPNHAVVHYNHGNALRALNRLDEALTAYDRAIALKPEYADAHDNRGVVLERLKRYDEALAAHDRALAQRPLSAEAHHNRGVALSALKRYDEALASFDRALALRPDLPEALNHRGAALGNLKRPAEALATLDRALALCPDYAEAIGNRGMVLVHLDRPEEALVALDRAMAALPERAAFHHSRGFALRAMGRHHEALSCKQQAVRLDPDTPEFHWNLGLTQLLLGDFANGWQNYEWRWRCEGMMGPPRQYDRPLWLGDADIAGRTILLHHEQGLGDTLQFCRYATQVAARGATVLLEVQKPLQALLAGLEGVHRVIASGETHPHFDFHCPLASLPLAFGTHIDSIPADIPYLSPDPAKVEAWSTRLAADGRMRVGVAVSGSATHNNDRNRSMPLASLLPLLAEPVQLVLLQKEIRDGDRQVLSERPEILSFADELDDFSDTAALVAAVDVVVSVDTSVAHLAGALGKPLWLLLPYVPEWRWLLEREDSPWYPTARLFRQAQTGDWASVVTRIRAALIESVAQP